MPADAPPPVAPAPSVALSLPPGPAARAAANRALAPGRAGSAVVSAGSTRPTPGGDVVHSMPAPRPSDRGPALAPPPALVSDQVPAPTAGRAGLAPPSTVPSLRPAPPADTTIGAGSAMAPPAWSAPVAATAGDLFQRANSARRAGDVGLARALYRQVEDRFPGSAEARLARVSLGKLLLAAGDARGAEDEFAHYLAGGSGPLVQEALVGRAESLQSLARPDEERRVWQRIVDEFPAGVYAAQARRRLTELGAPRRGPAR
jgi:TolA-binding protein